MSATLLLVAALLQAPPDTVARADTVEIVVVATTDLHGHVYHWDYLNDREAPWGLTRAATVVDSLRRVFPGRVVVVDAGDIIQGNPFATYFARVRTVEPHPVIDAMNAVGYDAAVVGNHDFTFGLEVLARAERSATFPLLGANVFTLPRDTVLYRPFVIVTRGGLRVAIAGFTTPGAMIWDRAHLYQRVQVRPVDAVARTTLAAMDAAGAAVRIVVIHSGMDGESSYDTTGVGPEHVAATLATLPVSPHLVIVGHSHRTMPDSAWRGVHFVQPAPLGRELSITHVRIARDPRGRTTVIEIRGETVPLAAVRPDPAVTRRLTEAHQQVRAWVETPLAQTPDTWSAATGRVEDTPLVDFVNEVQRRGAGADLSSASAFDTRAVFGPGAILLRDFAAVYPHENTLRAVRIDGGTLRAYLEQSAAYFGQAGTAEPVVRPNIPGFNYDMVSGVDYVVDVSRPVGERIVQLMYRGRLVTPADTFTLALSSNRQEGGGGFAMLQGLAVAYDRGENIRDLLVAAAQGAGTLRQNEWFTPSWRILPTSAQAALRAAFATASVVVDRARDTASVVPSRTRTAEPPALPAPAAAVAPLARLRFPLIRVAADESAFGNLVADAVRNLARVEIVLVPRDLLGEGLPAGDVRSAGLARAVADTALVVGRVSGTALLTALEVAVAGTGPAVAIAGLRVRWDASRRAGDRVREARLLDDRRIERGRQYTVAAPAGLVGDLTGDRVTLAAALAAYLPRLPQPVEPPPTGRWERRP